MNRDVSWERVWNDRDGERADWNGYESCFASPQAYLDWVDDVVAFIGQTLLLGPSDRVADLGCGTGRFAAAVGGMVASVTAIDYSHPAIELARLRRPAPNINYIVADLNSLDISALQDCTKAYAVGSLFYLTSVDYVFAMLHSLASQGISVLAVDLPDAGLSDERDRGYDRGQYAHLEFEVEQFGKEFPESTIHRGMFPGYVNDGLRFSVSIPGGAG